MGNLLFTIYSGELGILWRNQQKWRCNKLIVDYLRGSGRSSWATVWTEGREGGYQDTTVNDAQSYITFPEWIIRITARGQLPKYKEFMSI